MTLAPAFTTPRPDADRSDRPPGPDRVAAAVALTALLLFGAIFGFFYAWVCSTMWGLDDADPRTAIEAMQAMNASVRNAVFFPAFFLTPVVGLVAAAVLRRRGQASAARWFVAASIVYAVGGMLLTMVVNVPMNEDLAAVVVPTDLDRAAEIWADYSGRWQRWNVTRTVASGVALLLSGVGLLRMRR